MIDLSDGGQRDGCGTEVSLGGSRQQQRWTGAGVVIALVLAVGASVGVGRNDRTGPVPPATSAATATTLGDAAHATSTVEARTTTTLVAVEETTATPVERPTTTTLVQVGGGAPLLGERSGIELLVATTSGLVRLNLDSGQASHVDVGGFSLFDDLAMTTGGFVVWSGGSARIVAYEPDQPDTPISPVQLLGTDSKGQAWLLMQGDGTDPASLAVVTNAKARPLRVPLPWPLEWWPVAVPDGLGGAVVAAAGGVYHWAPDTPLRPIATGALVDAAGQYALTKTCYPNPTCELRVTNIATGQMRIVRDPMAVQWQAVRISPDGQWIVRDPSLSAGPGRLEGQVLELRRVDNTEVINLPIQPEAAVQFSSYQRSNLIWSPDNRWLIYPSGAHRLSAWHAGLDAPINIDIPTMFLHGPLGIVLP